MIQWFPGHMYKASKACREILPTVDVVVEVIDARLPGSSQNPMLARLRQGKPWVRVLNKVDMADDQVLQEWLDHFSQDDNAASLCCSPESNSISQLPSICESLVPSKKQGNLAVYAMIAGIPNVGKSTLINRLAGRTIAKAANEAAVTRHQQRIDIRHNFSLIDTPGMLWPKIINESSGYRLAASGAIRETAFDLSDVAAFVVEFMMTSYPDNLANKYGLTSLETTEIGVMEQIARSRGCLNAGGSVDYEKVSRIIVSDLKQGGLGQLCFERPEQFSLEIEEALRLEQLEKERKLAKKESRQARRKKNKRS